jgi:hypothetical protein
MQNSAPRNRRVENDDGLNGFAFSNTIDLEVFNAIHQIQSIGLDSVPIKFL